MGLPGGSEGKASACSAGAPGSIPKSGTSPGEGHDNPTPVFLPGESHGQRSLVGYSPWGHKRVRHDLVTKQQQNHLIYEVPCSNMILCFELCSCETQFFEKTL